MTNASTPTPKKMVNWPFRIGMVITAIVVCLLAYNIGEQLLSGTPIGLYPDDAGTTTFEVRDVGTSSTSTSP